MIWKVLLTSLALCGAFPARGAPISDGLWPGLIPKAVIVQGSCYHSELDPHLNYRLDILKAPIGRRYAEKDTERYWGTAMQHHANDAWDFSAHGVLFLISSWLPGLPPGRIGSYHLDRLDLPLLAAFMWEPKRGPGTSGRLHDKEAMKYAFMWQYAKVDFLSLKDFEAQCRGLPAPRFNYDIIAKDGTTVEFCYGAEGSDYEMWTCTQKLTPFKRLYRFSAPSAPAFRIARSNGKLFLLFSEAGVYAIKEPRAPVGVPAYIPLEGDRRGLNRAAPVDAVPKVTCERVSALRVELLVVDKDTGKAYFYNAGSLWELGQRLKPLPVAGKPPVPADRDGIVRLLHRLAGVVQSRRDVPRKR